MVGESLAAYVRRLRLERAAMFLARTGRPVTDIALDSGYDSHEAFTRAFRGHFGASPSAYRETARRGLPLPKSPVAPPKPQGDTTMEAKIMPFPKTRVAYVRHVGPYAQCEAAWTTLCAFAGPKGLLGPQTRFIGVCHDDPEVTPPEKIRYDACITVSDDVAAEGEVGLMDIGGGEYVTALHEGPYSGLHASYAELCGVALPKLGREPGYARASRYTSTTRDHAARGPAHGDLHPLASQNVTRPSRVRKKAGRGEIPRREPSPPGVGPRMPCIRFRRHPCQPHVVSEKKDRHIPRGTHREMTASMRRGPGSRTAAANAWAKAWVVSVRTASTPIPSASLIQSRKDHAGRARIAPAHPAVPPEQRSS